MPPRTTTPFQMMKVLVTLVLCVMIFAPVFAAEAASPKRPLRVDDLFNEEKIGGAQFSPDGQAVVFTRLRPASSQLSNGLLIPQTRGDIWLQSAPGSAVQNLTRGATDGSGWWDPAFSPDGQRLSFLSSRGGIVNAWVWERASGAIRQVTFEGVEFDSPSGGCRWVNARQLLCLGAAEGVRVTPMGFEGRGVEAAEAAWQKAKRGELTASEVNSREFKRPVGRLLLVDVSEASTSVLTTVARLREQSAIWLSSDATTVAFAEAVPSAYAVRDRIVMGEPGRLGLVRLDGRPLRLNRPLPDQVLLSSLAWSSDGQELAFFALGEAKISPELLYGEEAAKDVQHERAASREQPARLWRVHVPTGRVEQVDTGDIDLGQELLPPKFLWTDAGALLFYARRLSDRATPHVSHPLSWWVLGRDGNVHRLGPETTEIPASIKAIEGGKAFVWFADDDVWRIEARDGTVRNLTAALDSVVHRMRIFEPDSSTPLAMVTAGEPTDLVSQWVLRVDLNWPLRGTDEYVLDLASSGDAAKLNGPDPSAVLVAIHANTRSALYLLDHARGTSLWRHDHTGRFERLADLNTFYGDIARAEERIVEYQTSSGQPVKAKLTLPLGYVPGRRYPLVVNSDIGYEPENAPHMVSLIPDLPPTHHHVFMAGMFAAAGYAYAFVSDPTRTAMDDVGRANLLQFTDGIVPAVDKLVSLGIADRNQVFLFGESSFGFGVLGLITQTPRFKAAVSSVGWSDQSLFFNSISHSARYSDNPYDYARFAVPYSSSRLPVWRNADHYRRNSPLSYVDRVCTPLLLITPDMDALPMTNVENFFAALVAQRKTARHLRYWGEGHGVSTPANLRDQYQRIFAWFDEHGNIARDGEGKILFDKDGRVKGRQGQPPLTFEDFARFGPAAPSQTSDSRAISQQPVLRESALPMAQPTQPTR